MELFSQLVNGSKTLTIFAKGSILDVGLGSECAFAVTIKSLKSVSFHKVYREGNFRKRLYIRLHECSKKLPAWNPDVSKFKCPLYGVSALERFCYKGFLIKSSRTNFFVRFGEVSALGRFIVGQFFIS